MTDQHRYISVTGIYIGVEQSTPLLTAGVRLAVDPSNKHQSLRQCECLSQTTLNY